MIGFNNIAVIDPFWTLPFMFLLIVCLFMRRDNPVRIRWAIAATGYALAYMAFTFVNKFNVHNHMAGELQRQQIRYDNLYTSPSMFNNFLWAGIASTQDSIYLAEYSTLQDRKEIKWARYPRHLELIADHPAKRELKVLEWFSQGKYFIHPEGDELHFFIVKWGRMDFRVTEPHKAFVFYWKIFPDSNGWRAEPIEPDWGEGEFTDAWNSLWRRVRTADDY